MKNSTVSRCFVGLFLTLGLTVAFVRAQVKSEVEKVIENERLFARTASEKTIKLAFLEFLADDGLMFTPAQVNGKEYWRARPEKGASLTWYPVFADVSSNGALAYTTGRGEFRPNGAADKTIYYSEFFTVWRRQSDGVYRAALDVGVSHEKPPNDDKSWTSPKPTGKIVGADRPPAANFINKFFDTARFKSLDKAYKMFAAEDIRLLREGSFPILGVKNALAAVRSKSKIDFGKRMTQQSAGDLAYVVTTYEMKNGEKTTEKGNLIQVWKLFGDRWQIVADVFAPIPFEEKKGSE